MVFLLVALGCKGTVLLDDTQAPVDTAPVEPEPDFSGYQADLVWTYDTWGDSYDCTDISVETAIEVPEEDERHDGLRASCPLCAHFYEVSYDNSDVCDWIEIPDPDFRGMVFGEGSAQVYRFDEKDGEFSETLLDNAATWDGWTLSFNADFQVFGDLFVDSTAAFEAL